MDKKFNSDEVASLISLNEIERPFKISFALNLISDQDVYAWFRFTRENPPRRSLAFGFPSFIHLKNRSKFSDMEALCVLLRRLSYPHRYGSIKHTFCRSELKISMIFTWAVEFIDANFGHLLTSLELFWFDLPHMLTYCAAISKKNSPLPDIFDFIDGTFRPVCRPGEDQRTLYSGHYRLHGIKFQLIMIRNGLVSNLDGPWVGRRHDSGILAESGLRVTLREKITDLGRHFRLYGDPAYPINQFIEGPFKEGAKAFI